MIWTQEQRDELIRLWDNGKRSYAEIGRIMGFNKNQIVGRMHREKRIQSPQVRSAQQTEGEEGAYPSCPCRACHIQNCCPDDTKARRRTDCVHRGRYRLPLGCIVQRYGSWWSSVLQPRHGRRPELLPLPQSGKRGFVQPQPCQQDRPFCVACLQQEGRSLRWT